MKRNFKEFFSTAYIKSDDARKAVVISIVLAVVLNLMVWAVAGVIASNNDPAAVLHYSSGVGVDFIGTSKQILNLPIIGIIVLVFNLFLSRMLHETQERAVWLLVSITPIVQAVLLLAVVMLWRANL